MQEKYARARLELQEVKQSVKSALNLSLSAFRKQTRHSLFASLSDKELKYLQLALEAILGTEPEKIQAFQERTFSALVGKTGEATLKKILENKAEFDTEGALRKLRDHIGREHTQDLNSFTPLFAQDLLCYPDGKDALVNDIRERISQRSEGRRRPFVGFNKRSTYKTITRIASQGFLEERKCPVANLPSTGKRKITHRNIIIPKPISFSGQELSPNDILAILEIINAPHIDEDKTWSLFRYAMNLPLPDLRQIVKRIFELQGHVPAKILLSIFSDDELREETQRRRTIADSLRDKLKRENSRYGEITDYDLREKPLIFQENTTLIDMIHLASNKRWETPPDDGR